MRRILGPRFRTGPLFLASAATLPAYVLLNSDSLPSSARPNELPLRALIRSYIVYSLCSIPALVDHSPKLLEVVANVPGLRQVAFGLVKVTFFDQFVGGETASATLPLLRALRAANKGAIFSYSVEVDESEARGSGEAESSSTRSAGPNPHKRIVEEILRSIDVAADFEDSIRGGRNATVPYHSVITGSTLPSTGIDSRGMWVAVKLTAMLPSAHALISFSKCITAAREEMKRNRSDRKPLDPEDISLERLVEISTGKETIRPEDIPFPGCPLPLDMDHIYLLDRKAQDNEPLMTPQEIREIYDLYTDLVSICERAQDRGVRLLMDAEYSWYQPAIDALTLALMRRFNALPVSASEREQLRPLVYATYQAYLRRTPLYLAHTIQDAKENGYALGVKLVRGAYHGYEVDAHAAGPEKSLSISPDPLPPVWATKPDTDKAYNDCVRLAIHAIKEDIDASAPATDASDAPSSLYGRLKGVVTGSSRSSSPVKHNPGQVGIGFLFGTHNWDSCNLILDQIQRVGLGRHVTVKVENGKEVEKIELSDEVTKRVSIGQLYGMCDDLTDTIVHQTISASPIAVKYLPYGAMKEVLPYLSRRAVENKSVLGDGGAAKERKRAAKEIRRRVAGWFGLGSD